VIRLALLVVMFGALGACGPSPETVCKEQVAADCERMWTCGASVKIGSDAASCAAFGGGFCGLAVGASTYNVANAQTCTKELKAQSCDAYKAGKPASCASN
jgi:hypothetical protein